MRTENKSIVISPLIRLIILVALGHFVIDFMLSIWPVYKTMVRLDLAKAGLIAGGSIVAGELMQLYFGKLIDKGYQKMLLIVGPLFASAAIFFPYFNSYFPFFILILFTCIGSAAFHPTAASLLAAIDTPRKALLLGFFQTAGNFGMGVGQFFFAKTYDMLYGHTAVLLLPVLALLAMVWISDAPISKPPSVEKISLKIIFKFFRSKPLRSLYFVQVANQTILWSTVFLLPDFLVARGASHAICFGGGHFALLLGATLVCIPVSMLSTKITPAKTIFGSFILTICLYYFLLGMPDLDGPALLVTLFAVGGLLGSMTPLSLALGNELAYQNRGMVSAFLMGLVWIVSEGIGIGLSGALADLFTDDAPAKALACLGALLFAGSYFAFKLVSYRAEEIAFVE